MSYYIGCPSRVNWPFTLCPVQRQKLQLQLYSFTFNLQLHDSFHPRIGEPNRGGGRDTNLKKEKKKITISQTVPAVAK